ncbi:MAG: hypothetical protein M1835_005738 [Candelina submexicana]|nr:MAG: hypothetical protein M1835_005738 [Candelina submexicana]
MSPERKRKASDSIHRDDEVPASGAKETHKEVDERRQNMAKSEIKAGIDLSKRISIAFLRRQGYRRIGNTTWLAFAADAEYPSHDLAPSDDHDCLKLDEESEEDLEDSHKEDQYDRQLLGELDFSDKIGKLKKLEGSEEELLLHYAMTILNDEESAVALINTSATIPVSDSQWDTTDGRGNTVLHLAASHSYPASVAWILDSTLGARLIGKVNLNGETPLEALQTRLELRRVKYQAFKAQNCNGSLISSVASTMIQSHVFFGSRICKTQRTKTRPAYDSAVLADCVLRAS